MKQLMLKSAIALWKRGKNENGISLRRRLFLFFAATTIFVVLLFAALLIMFDAVSYPHLRMEKPAM